MSVAGSNLIQNMAEHDALALVQSLRADRVAGDADLPCFPQSAVRLQHLLSDTEVALNEVIKVISFDPVLTGRVLQLANSAALNSTGKRIGDIKTAMNRVGFDMARSAAIALGLKMLARAQSNAEIRTHLEGIWERSAWTAAVAYVVAKRFTQVGRDQAFLAGLLHGIGRLYVLTRVLRHPLAMQNRGRFRAISREWQGVCAKSVLTAWKVPAPVLAAVLEYENLNRSGTEEPDLTDVLTVSYMIVGYIGKLQSLAHAIDKIQAFARMHLTLEVVEATLLEAQAEIESLRRGLV
jgi:HD-like signal output (HDOD) protein